MQNTEIIPVRFKHSWAVPSMRSRFGVLVNLHLHRGCQERGGQLGANLPLKL